MGKSISPDKLGVLNQNLTGNDANEYDAENYASIDSQLGKYDVNFHRASVRKVEQKWISNEIVAMKVSNEIVAMQYN